VGRPENPIDPQDGPVQRFAYELRKLRDEAGAPAYRAMARRAGYSAATLSQAAAGERLPTLAVLMAFVEVCRGDTAYWRSLWQQVNDELAQLPRTEDDDANPPYRGLARFEPDDAELFFGRDQLIGDLLQSARSHRIIALIGASGSGKSSLLRAGLVPRLRHTDDAALRPAALRILTPGEHPPSADDPRLTPKNPDGTDADTWLLVDQFEELYTLCQDPAERTAFIDRLLDARAPSSRLRTVIAIRADFYGRCLEHQGLTDVLRDAALPVGPMANGELKEAIVKPAAARGLIVERELTARIIEEVADEHGALPLMSHALMETWRRRRGRALTMQAYEAAGGLHGAIAHTAEDAYRHLTPGQTTLARRILLRLIAPGNGTEDTHRPTPRTEFTTADHAARADVDAVIDRLAGSRLLTLDEGKVFLAHEALIIAWPRLQGWINEERDRLRLHRQLTHDATAWHELDRDPGALYRGSRLAQADEAFTGQPPEVLNPLEAAFLDASIAAEHRHERRTRHTLITLATLLCLALIAATVAYQQRNDAEHQRRQAVSRELATRSGQLSEQRPEAAMALALRGYRQAPTTEARSSLLSAYAHFYANQFTGHTQRATATAFAPKGHTLATGSFDHSVKLWDTRSHRLLATLTGHTGTIDAVVFSPNGRTLATTSEDRSVKLWDTRSHRLLATLTGHTDEVGGVAFSPNGRTLASAGRDRTVRLWDLRTHRQRAVLTAHGDRVGRVAFSPNGRMLASTGEGTTRLWDVSSHNTLAILAGRTGAAVAFSPDGRILATADDHRSVLLWDVRSHRLLATLSGHTYQVWDVAFSPDGRTLASLGTNGTIRLWRPQTRKALATLNVGPPNYVIFGSLAFSPDGHTLASTGKDSTVRLWDVTSHQPVGTLSGHSGVITSQPTVADRRAFLTVDYDISVARWSTARPRTRPPIRVPKPFTASVASNDAVAAAGYDGVIRVWSLATGRRIATLPAGTGVVWQLAITPDGNTLAASSDDGTIRVWDITARRTTAVLRGSPSSALALRPDGRALASLRSGTTDLWTTRSGQAATPLPGPKNGDMSLAFSPDGHSLAAGSGNGIIRVWDVAARRTTAVLRGHTGVIERMAFSADGSTLAATTSNEVGSIRLWNTRTARLRAILTDTTLKEGPPPQMRFSSNGHALATLTRNGARVWNTDADYVATRVCRLSADHRWAQILPDQPVKDLCPA
jgi:WD40 repeat protein/transcriptional regulator with XRE-family HTH domain